MPAMEIKKVSMEELGRISPNEYKKSKKAPVCLILDNIRSLQNVGSFFRTADAFRIEKIYLCGITGQPPHRDIEKTALGASDSVPFEYYKDIEVIVKKLKDTQWNIVALEQTEQSTVLENFEPNNKQKYAFIFGNEVFGVKQEVLQMADQILEIPQFGTKHSLNVSVSAGIVLWDFYLKNKLNLCSNPS